MMEVTLTCPECKSAVEIHPSLTAKQAQCGICQTTIPVMFSDDDCHDVLETCPCCSRKDFYSQKDFNRMIGVSLFVLAAILSIFTYGLSFVALYIADLLLFKKLSLIAVCYNCNTIFRKVKNIKQIHPYDHEMNDRIVYAGHDFKGQAPEH